MLQVFKNTKLLDFTFNRKADLLGVKVNNTSDFADTDYLPHYIGLKILEPPQD